MDVKSVISALVEAYKDAKNPEYFERLTKLILENAAHNASLREKEEAKPNVTSLVNFCQTCGQPERIHDDSKWDHSFNQPWGVRLSAEPEPSEQKATQAPQMALRKLISQWEVESEKGTQHPLISKTYIVCVEQLERYLSEHAPESVSASGASSSKP